MTTLGLETTELQIELTFCSYLLQILGILHLYDHVNVLMHMKHCASTSMCDLLLHIKMTLKLSTSIDK